MHLQPKYPLVLTCYYVNIYSCWNLKKTYTKLHIVFKQISIYNSSWSLNKQWGHWNTDLFRNCFSSLWISYVWIVWFTLVYYEICCICQGTRLNITYYLIKLCHQNKTYATYKSAFEKQHQITLPGPTAGNECTNKKKHLKNNVIV